MERGSDVTFGSHAMCVKASGDRSASQRGRWQQGEGRHRRLGEEVVAVLGRGSGTTTQHDVWGWSCGNGECAWDMWVVWRQETSALLDT